ncbi:uncharacterized protein LOC111388859 [Olea europaea var. sylvestris]|uniref:uncharacterized protein LOC111388859 n=1 Tax=Olea europaea var. sylvestris TaxID=158386 RepID=UPI000C1D6E98|nr:uncharacterized protein LOC111388859 [Olea europaea var. sylvestris]
MLPKAMVNTRSGLPHASSSAPIPQPAEDQPAPHEESSGMPAPLPAVITIKAFEEFCQQVGTLTQLLSKKNSHLSPAQAEHGGFMVDARPPNPATGGVGTSGINNMASDSIFVAMNSGEIARIIQEGITAGQQRNARGPMGFTPNTPFTPEILSYPLPDRLKYPRIKEYDGTIDPINHLNVYTDVMNLQVAPDQVMCKAFPQMLTNAARDWFSTLEPNSIALFSDFADNFSTFFASSKRIRKIATSLMQLRQGLNETLRGFITRFNKERLQIPDIHITAAVSALTYAIGCEAFKMSLSKTPPQTVTMLLNRAKKYINMEKTLNPRRAGHPHEKVENKRQHDLVPLHELPRDKRRNEASSTPLTWLNISKANILMEINDMKELKWPSRIKSPSDTRDRSKGFLRNYIGHDKRSRNDRDNRKESGIGSSAQPTARTINIIVEGIAFGGDTNSGRKQYARQHAHTPKESRDEVKDITFGARDLEGISYPHDDALVVSAVVANFKVKRILVDNGSAANIFSQEAFAKMGISLKQFKAIKTPLQGFGGGVIIPEDIVELPLTLGSGNTQVMEITPFQVVNTPMAYNIILGRPLLNKIQAIV